MQIKGLSKLISETAIKSGVIEKTSLLEGEKSDKRRNKVSRTQGFRKTVTTKMIEAGLNDFAIEKLLGHKSKDGITSKHYYRPDEEALLTEYKPWII
jgi:integrase